MNHQTRRRFLKRVAAAAAAVAAPCIVPSSVLGAAAPSEQITVGKLGCGSRGGGIGGVGGVVVAAYDPWKSRREQFRGAKAYDDWRELLADPGIDAVAIASPDHWHVPLTIAAARAGKDMFTEKPLGVSIAEDLACRRAVCRYGRIFQYGTQQRSMGHCRFGCELVRNGLIGELREIQVHCPDGRPGGSWGERPVPPDLDYEMWLGPAPWRPYMGQATGGGGWYFTYDYSIGWIAGWGAHPLDILVWGFDTHLAGKWEVEGTGFIDRAGRNDAVCNWRVRIQFGNGVRLTFRPQADGDRFRDYTRFVGTRGWVGISRDGLDAEPASLLKEQIQPGMIRLPESRSVGKNFIDAVRSRRDPVSNIDDAVRSDIISHVSDIAIRLGRKVVWDSAAERFVGDDEATRMTSRAAREPWGL